MRTILSMLMVSLTAGMVSTHQAQGAVGGQTEFGEIWKVTYSSLDAEEAAIFCRDVLGMEDIPISDPSLENGHRWLRYGKDNTEVHFVTAVSQEQKNYLKNFISTIDYNRNSFTDWMNSHVGIWVDDLSPLISRLQEKSQPFLGPVLRADGLYQLYVRVPGAGYLEFDTLTMPEEDHLHLVKDWAGVWQDRDQQAREKLLSRTNLYGGKSGVDFDTSLDWDVVSKIKSITINWDNYIHAMTVQYDSNYAVTFGAEFGKNTDTLTLEEGEYINNGIVCVKSKSAIGNNRVVSLVKFFTNTGRQVYYGDSGDDCFWLIWNGEHEVVGLHGRASSQIDSLGFVFKPVKQDD